MAIFNSKLLVYQRVAIHQCLSTNCNDVWLTGGGVPVSPSWGKRWETPTSLWPLSTALASQMAAVMAEETACPTTKEGILAKKILQFPIVSHFLWKFMENQASTDFGRQPTPFGVGCSTSHQPSWAAVPWNWGYATEGAWCHHAAAARLQKSQTPPAGKLCCFVYVRCFIGCLIACGLLEIWPNISWFTFRYGFSWFTDDVRMIWLRFLTCLVDSINPQIIHKSSINHP